MKAERACSNCWKGSVVDMGFKDAWSSAGYGEENRTNSYKANSALTMLYASDYGYDEWKNICIAFKAAGGEENDWLSWCAIDAQRYVEKDARTLYRNVKPDGAITAKSLWKLAWDAGWDWREKYDAIPKVRTVPPKLAIEARGEQAARQLEAMFAPDDYVNVVTDATLNDKGKWVPKGYGKQYRCDALCESLREHGMAAVGAYNEDAGVWLRVNPMDGRGIGNKNVKRYANALIESDDMALIDQERLLFELNMPILAMTSSGGKSIHAVVSIDADGANHYADRVKYLHDVCERAGFSVDKANKNGSRLTRLAGAKRGEGEQRLMHVNVGASDFTAWMRQEHTATVSYDYGIQPLDTATPVVLDEVLIDGIMRRGDKMCVAGASKSYKSFSLIQLGIACAVGGKWFGWNCKKGRVLYVNCELRGESFRSRVLETATAMNADFAQIAANFDVWNMRGRVQPLELSKEHIITQAQQRGYDMIILDPIYKLFDGDENDAHDVSAFMLAMDELAMRLHASVVYCHHHSKGAKGGTAAQDRFSGSGVFARDCDALVDISPLDLKDADVTDWGWDARATAWRIETVIRDFEPKPPIDVIFEYPIHHVDTTGYLSDFKLFSPQSAGGEKRAAQLQAQRDKNVAKMESYLDEYFSTSSEPVPVSWLSQYYEKTPKTIATWVEKSNKFRLKKYGKTNVILPERQHRESAS